MQAFAVIATFPLLVDGLCVLGIWVMHSHNPMLLITSLDLNFKLGILFYFLKSKSEFKSRSSDLDPTTTNMDDFMTAWDCACTQPNSVS